MKIPNQFLERKTNHGKYSMPKWWPPIGVGSGEVENGEELQRMISRFQWGKCGQVVSDRHEWNIMYATPEVISRTGY